ncbi:hypothetical protein M0805_002498 [Coniferiporia weirii]|nr:hypothetical protein M0805_002498 [Coniferiporia weirii]
MLYRILVASYTDAVYTLVFDPFKPADAALSLSSTLTVGHHPSWLECHPSDPTLVFTGLEQGDGRLLAMKYDANTGEGKVLANVSSGGSDPCTILVTEDQVLVGNYSSGTVGVFNLSSSSGSVILKEAQPPLQFSGSGPCTERQETSHPHQVYLTPFQPKDGAVASTELLVPDLGADKIWRLNRSNVNGKWEKKGAVELDKHRGGGPRHVVVHGTKLYTLLELTNKLVVHDLLPLVQEPSKEPNFLAEVTLPMPSSLPPLTVFASELLLPPTNASFPSPLLYASLRNDPHAHKDGISIFSALSGDKSGETSGLEVVGSVYTGLTHLRGFTFFGPDLRYVVAGGVFGGGVKIFERTDGGRSMKEVAHLPAHDGGAGLAPTTFLCL